MQQVREGLDGIQLIMTNEVRKNKDKPDIELFSVCKHDAPDGKDHATKDHAVRQVHKRTPEAGCPLLRCQVVNLKDPSL